MFRYWCEDCKMYFRDGVTETCPICEGKNIEKVEVYGVVP